ncbi:hypothetical protein DAERI_040181 [Deinococcus aerius]|uniref:Uncharacterized protein n=1 Tax=Deinococcus aerius TaxID=200253 RepID=A0A2I9DKL0_9DEIO|nr:hypothetical protein [Deinococcus aerius]GBF05421.1 hypothetical protein DAERI_040181 [Deinococcus aerius]
MNGRPLSRDQRVGRVLLGFGLGGGGLSLLGALLAGLGRQRGLEPLASAGTLLLAALPLLFAGMMVLAVRRMDEYGRQLQTRAAGVAFLAVMVLSASLIALEPALHFRTPSWVIYVTGMLVWGLSAAVIARRDP